LEAVAKAKGKSISEVTVTIIKRERNRKIIDEIRAAGARIKFFHDGDVAGAINTCFDWTGLDIMLGIGGAPVGAISAVGVKSLAAESNVMSDDLMGDDEAVCAATAASDGEMMNGVQSTGGYADTPSAVMRAQSGAGRFMKGRHSP